MEQSCALMLYFMRAAGEREPQRSTKIGGTAKALAFLIPHPSVGEPHADGVPKQSGERSGGEGFPYAHMGKRTV